MTNPLRKLWRAATPAHSGRKKDAKTRPVGNELLLKERRTVKRHFYPLAATVRYGVAASEERVGIYNFSEKGLCFRSDVRFPLGAAVEITAQLPQRPLFDGRKVRYRAHVTRVALERGQFTVGAAIYSCETLAPGTDVIQKGAEQYEGAKQPETTRRKTQTVRVKRENSAKLKTREGRQFSRYNCSSLVQFRTADGGSITSGELSNLSLGGCYVQTAEPCPVGASLEIVLQAGKTRIYTQGRVTALEEKQGMRVKFESNLQECLQRLPRFVQVVSKGQSAGGGRSN